MAASRDSKKKPAPTTGTELRKRRPRPDRVGPRRGPQGYVRADEGGTGGDEHPGDARADRSRRRAAEAADDVITRAVELGYKVAEEQIRKSRAAADSLQKASAALGRGDPGEALAQSLHTAKAIGDMATHLLESASGNTQWLAQVLGGEGGANEWKASLQRLRDLLGGASAEAAGTEGHGGGPSWDGVLQQSLDAMRSMSQSFAGSVGGRGGPAGRVLVVCDRMASSATLSFSRRPASAALVCDGLVGRAGDQPALLTAKIGPITEAEGLWECVVKVGRGVAPGTYRGVVLDGETSVGWLELALRKV